MYVFAEPVTEDQIADIQASNAAKVEEFESSIKASVMKPKVDLAQKGQDGAGKVQSAVRTDVKEVDPSISESGMPTSGVNALSKADVKAIQELPSPAADNSQAAALERSDLESPRPEVSDLEAFSMEAHKSPLPSVSAETQEELEDEVEDLQLSSKYSNLEADVTSVDVVDTVVTESGSDALATDEEAKIVSKTMPCGLNTDIVTEDSPPVKYEGHDPEETDEGKSVDPFSTSTEKLGEEVIAGKDEVLGMMLTINNRVNGIYVNRPDNLTRDQRWEAEYSLEVIQDSKAWSLYEACRNRRKKALEDSDDNGRVDHYALMMKQLSQRGAKHRAMENSLSKGSKFNEKVVYGRPSSNDSQPNLKATAAKDPASGPAFKRVELEDPPLGILLSELPKAKQLRPAFDQVDWEKISSTYRPSTFVRQRKKIADTSSNMAAKKATPTAQKSPAPPTTSKSRKGIGKSYTHIVGSNVIRREPTSRLLAMRKYASVKAKTSNMLSQDSAPRVTGSEAIISLPKSESDKAVMSL